MANLMLLIYSFLQYDLQGSSQMQAPGPHLLQAKDRLWEAIDSDVHLYGGERLNRSGDGAVFVFPVYDPSLCTQDEVVVAALRALLTVQFLNKLWDPKVQLDYELLVRISCHTGSIWVDPNDLSSAHGDDLDWFCKAERQIALPRAITITHSVYNEIQAPSIRNLFVRREKPYLSEVRGEKLTTALYTCSEEAIAPNRPAWEKYWEAVNELAKRLESIKDEIRKMRATSVVSANTPTRLNPK